jgi:hypothetical protein
MPDRLFGEIFIALPSFLDNTRKIASAAEFHENVQDTPSAIKIFPMI